MFTEVKLSLKVFRVCLECGEGPSDSTEFC